MKVFKIIIDILLLIDTFVLVNIEITGNLIHEILGITMAILLLIHIVTNWNWIKSVTKNLKKVNKKNKSNVCSKFTNNDCLFWSNIIWNNNFS